MRLIKFYQVSTLLIILMVASFSTVEAAHYKVTIPQSTEVQPTKKELRKSLRKETKNLKSIVKSLFFKKVRKGKKSQKNNLTSGVLSFVFGLLSAAALLIGFIFLLIEGGIGFLVLALLAAIIGVIFFVVSMVKTQESENPTGGIILSILGVILSMLSGLITGILLYEEA
jgi:Flp pilus assembly protein TadB